MSKENNTRYAEMCELLNDYVSSNFDYPKATTEYRGEKLGSWLRAQVYSFKKNELSDERITMLNQAFLSWNGTSEEKERRCVEVFTEKWNTEIKYTIKGIPVDEILKGSDLLKAYNNGIMNIDDLISNHFSESPLFNFKDEDILKYKFPNIDFRYYRLMNAILGGHPVDLEYLDRIPFTSPEEMNNTFVDVIGSLTEREQIIIMNRFIHHMDLISAGKLLSGITRERVRQIEAKALRKLRHPSRLNRIICKSVESAAMIKSGLSREQFIFLYDNGMLFETYSTIVSGWSEVKEQDKIGISGNNEQISTLNLSIRCYNCLRRAGLDTIGDVVKVFEDIEKVRNIRNLGLKCAEEMYSILCERFPDNSKLQENNISILKCQQN